MSPEFAFFVCPWEHFTCRSMHNWTSDVMANVVVPRFLIPPRCQSYDIAHNEQKEFLCCCLDVRICGKLRFYNRNAMQYKD